MVTRQLWQRKLKESDMPAVSKAQQRFFGMVRATQKGEMENPSPEVAKVAATAKRSDVKKFASTKHDKLPEKKRVEEERNCGCGQTPCKTYGKKKVQEGFKTDILTDRKYAKRVLEREKQNKERDSRIKHGKNWKQFTRDVESVKTRLRPGEVKKWDKEKKKYVSNKD